MVLKNDKQAIQAAIKTCNILDKHHVRMVKIKNTNELGLIEVSENLSEEVRAHVLMKIEGVTYELSFDENDNLSSLD